jgi:hypothetical protein
MKMKKLLWLDDIRDPFVWSFQYAPDYEQDEVSWVKNYTEFTEWITKNGLPDMICFDHDLGNRYEKTGHDCAKWLVEYCINNNLNLPKWGIQSANPTGRDNINGLLNNYKKFRNENNTK